MIRRIRDLPGAKPACLQNKLNTSPSVVSKIKGKGRQHMKATRITVKWQAGLHMRSAARLVKLARSFRSRIRLRVGSHVADARSIMSIMLLAASLGSTLDVEASGDDEHEAIQAVQAYFDGQALNP